MLATADDIDLVPDQIPLYFKIPVKGLNGPLQFCFDYAKNSDPYFNPSKSDLLVFLSEKET